MMTRPSLIVLITLSAALLGALLSPGASLAQPSPQWVARAASVQGTVEVRRVGEARWQAVQLNDQFAPGDTIRVQERSRADLAMLDQSVLRLNGGTEMTVEAVKEPRTGVVDLLRGAAHFLSRGPRSLEVQTPFTTAGVRGTEFLVAVEPDRTLMTIFEGTVVAENQAGSLILTGGQSAVAEAGKPPALRVVARPRDAVHWALHYPPVLYFRADEFPAGPDWQGMVRQSLDAYYKGDFRRAFDAIATVPPTVPDPRFFTYRAHLLLAVGRTDEAARDIAQALRLTPNDADALALQTIVAVVQGERQQALEIARNAVQSAPTAATPRIALSYAQQARFDLEGARASLQEAVGLEPQNALAWARLSELEASFGRLGRALDAARRAAALEPNLSRTQTVLGFAHLMRVETKQAREAFEKAIALDQADPLPRLGLGLAKIREGQLDPGGRDIEVAASLDPNNAIVRAYLGKTYYEEKRTGLDEREYAVAQQLDPNDPTPWFYDAISKQTTNRPVEALQSLERAIELNDNRAVYRSRLLLDEDLAARSASLARIYGDLGFEQLALVEGWKSVNLDPGNFSAHRFLADSYAVLPRHEIARVSELLQSQLLQPLNLTPIQPRLAESNLFLISAGGPGTLSFNEFNPLFNRDRLALQVSGLAGENDTYGGEAVLSGIYRKASFSLGYTGFNTDGFRPNSDQTDHLFNAFLQFELSPSTSLQAEYRYRNLEQGDVQQRFFREDFFRTLRNEEDRHTFRLGGRHTFSPGSILLASVTYQDKDARLRTDDFPDPGSFSVFHVPETAFGAELQHLFRSRYVNLRTGAGYFDVQREQRVTFGFPGIDPIRFVTDADLQHANVYAYADLNAVRNVTVTVGLSYDSLSGDEAAADKDQVNPKVGITWNPFPGTTLRAAAFRSLKRTLITDQTLEPTQVAGFNQFFDDVNLTEAWRYGAAIDQKLTHGLFGGVEVSKRDLTVPILDVSDPFDPRQRDVDWDEYLGRAYVFWTPHRWLALRAEYLFERFERAVVGPLKLDTHRVPLGARFFHPSGFGASATMTYWNQKGTFTPFVDPTVPLRTGRDDFWLVDASLSYRLPKRYGFITVGATNLLDRKFRFFEVDFDNPTIQPTRAVFARLTLAFP
jgi:tetratricopeptide (TPR) repeat protein